ncbi:MAG: hypothetical protein V1944_00350 [Candidatus Aenigmatarchaeota archaeon]
MTLPFGKKNIPAPVMTSGKVPTERVGELSAKGFPEGEIIDVLRRDGYSADDIDRAMTQVLKLGVTGTPTQPQVSNLPQLEPLESMQQQMPQMPETSIPEQYYYPQQQQPQYSSEEYIDFLVKERVGEVDHKIQEFIVKNAELEKRLAEINNQITALVQTRTTEEQAILSRLDSYKDVLEDVSIRMGSLEKAFKETLPALIESVRALSDLVQRMKREG